MSQDIGYMFHVDPQEGMIIDLALADNGDIVSIANEIVCLQNLTIWLMTRMGDNPLLPTWGNPLLDILQKPITNHNNYADIFDQAQMTYVAEQDNDIALGLLSPSYRIVSFSDTTVQLSSPPLVTISTIVHFANARVSPLSLDIKVEG